MATAAPTIMTAATPMATDCRPLMSSRTRTPPLLRPRMHAMGRVVRQTAVGYECKWDYAAAAPLALTISK